MAEISTQLSNLRRPRLLVSAARHGLSDYRRSRDLRRIAGHSLSTSPRAVVAQLLDQEEQIEQTRLARDGTYSANKHVELLVALMAESRVLTSEPSPAPRTAHRQDWRPKVV